MMIGSSLEYKFKKNLSERRQTLLKSNNIRHMTRVKNCLQNKTRSKQDHFFPNLHPQKNRKSHKLLRFQYMNEYQLQNIISIDKVRFFTIQQLLQNTVVVFIVFGSDKCSDRERTQSIMDT